MVHPRDSFDSFTLICPWTPSCTSLIVSPIRSLDSSPQGYLPRMIELILVWFKSSKHCLRILWRPCASSWQGSLLRTSKTAEKVGNPTFSKSFPFAERESKQRTMSTSSYSSLGAAQVTTVPLILNCSYWQLLLLTNDLSQQQDGYVGFANLPNQVHRKSVKKGENWTFKELLNSIGRFQNIFEFYPQSKKLKRLLLFQGLNSL